MSANKTGQHFAAADRHHRAMRNGGIRFRFIQALVPRRNMDPISSRMKISNFTAGAKR